MFVVTISFTPLDDLQTEQRTSFGNISSILLYLPGY